MNEQRYDAVVAGGGPVGASAAVLLARQGLTVAVIEPVAPTAVEQPSFDDRAIALGAGAARALDPIGVWDTLRAQATPIEHVHVTAQDHWGATRLSARDEGVAALGYVLTGRTLGAVLNDALRAEPNVTVLCPARVTGLDRTVDRVRVRVAVDGGGDVTVTGRLLVGADGARSTVRTLAGIDADTVAYGQDALVANVATARPHRHTAFERFTDTGAVALLPVGERRSTLVWSLPAGEAETLRSQPESAFLAALQAAFGWRLGAFEQVGVRHAYPLARVRAAAPVGARVALIGNAAHMLHPIAAQGFNLGLRDAAMLAEAIRAGADPGAAAVLDTYRTRREADERTTLAFTDGLTRAFRGRFAPVNALRSAGLVAFNLLAPLRHGLARQAMGLRGRRPLLATEDTP